MLHGNELLEIAICHGNIFILAVSLAYIHYSLFTVWSLAPLALNRIANR